MMKYFDEVVDKSSNGISQEKVRDLFDVNRRMIDYSAGIVQYDLKFFDEHCLSDVSGFGTGKDEVCHSVGDYLDLIERSWKQRPEDMRFEFNTLRATLFDEVALIEGLTIITFRVAAKDLQLSGRLSTIYNYAGNGWKLQHVHFSSPLPDQLEGESFPIAALLEKNAVLERLVNERTLELNASMEKLVATQEQLVRSEKLAALGEVTAGVAHEIQNPLNFILNFSEVNTELIKDIMSGDLDKDEMFSCQKQLSDNIDKVVHHCKRADSIVKSMLQHSRLSPGYKERTDLNNLIEEFVRLSYHGMKANHDAFNGEYSLSLDRNLPPVLLIPQDIGRVLLNILNNAFYSTTSRKKYEGQQYKGQVNISTFRRSEYICIRIEDNGTGIPTGILNKIWQPFFTTKGPGQGTGLGLSLSYEIITKGHDGKITVHSAENEGAAFEICLPIN